jgi:DNA-binding winged helix-turn-helix (wHTH) protein/TolB-like protein
VSRFGEFIFDHETRRLTRNGELIKLQSQPSRLLAELLIHNHRIVTREELKNALWGDETYVDFEKGLNFCIGQIRAALQDNAARPLYIRTFPKQGYRFVAPVQAYAEPTDQSVSIGTDETRAPGWVARVAIAAAIIVGTGATALVFRWREEARKRPNLAVVRFDLDSTAGSFPRIGDALTDDVVIQLSEQSHGHYRVIGNASILRQERDKRDLKVIGASLKCSYAVLGQVRVDRDDVLVLAHLIRLSDQTHISVVRIESTVDNPRTFEDTAAAQIASRFAMVMANDPDRATSFVSPAR